MKKIIYLIIYIMLTSPFAGWGQNIVEHCDAWSTNQSQSNSHISKVKVELQSGFWADGTNKTFVFGYDDHIICSLGDDHIIDPNNPNEFQHDVSLPVGAIAGAAGVSPTGSATYTIPIFASPGINGVEPKISVNYNSHGGNGILGIGWSLGGLSAISLSPNLRYNDGFFEAIKFNSNGSGKDRYQERFALDGNRLVVQSDGTYRTEIETFQKIEKVGSGFKSTTKEGMKIFYGSSENSRIRLSSGSGNKILSWLIDKIEDANGNYMEYEYQNENGEKLIKSIKYTGNGSLAPFNSVEFYYGTRRDKSQGYVSGTRFDQTVLLEKIKCFCEEELVKEYVFKYVVDTKNVTRLAKIEENSDLDTKLNSTNISWGAKGTTQLKSLLTNQYFITEHVNPKINAQSDTYYLFRDKVNVQYFSGDFNGDGHLDLGYVYNFCIYRRNWLYQQVDHKYYSYCGTFINNGNGGFEGAYTHEISLQYYYAPYAGDFDYDGKTEINVINQTNSRVYRMKWNDSNKTWNEEQIVSPKNTPTNDSYYAGNFTGDGKIQQLYVSKSRKGGSIFEEIEIKNENGVSEYSASTAYIGGDDAYNYSPIMTDFDGDGITDFINIIDKDGLYGVFEYNPDATTEKLQLIYEIPEYIIKVTGNNKFRAGDFNGDGKTDLIVRDKKNKKIWYIYISTGKEFVLSGAIIADNDKDVTVCDINGDGKDDVILQPHNNKIVLYLSRGDGNFDSTTISITDEYDSDYSKNYNFAFGDFNNDGVNAIIFGVREPQIIYYNKNDRSKQVVSITDGMKRKTQFEYSPLNKVSTEKANIAGDIYPLIGPMKVVTKLTEPTGLTTSGNNTTATTYKYDKGKIHVSGKGFLGFEKTTVKNEKANMSIVTTNSLDLTRYVISKTTVETKTFNGNSNIAKQETEFLIRKMATPTHYVALLPKKTTTYDYLLHSGNSTVTNYNYANETIGTFLGNPSTVITNSSGIYSQTTTYTNYTAAGSWCESKPQNIQTTRTQNSQTVGSKTTIVYDGKGRIQSSETNDYQESGGKPLTTTFTYDKFGNVLTTKASGIYNEQNQAHTRASSFQYEPTKGRFLIEATDAAGLATTYEYDPKFGNKISEKDPLGNEIFYAYNKFGILTGIQAPLGNSSITRNWTSLIVANNTFTETITTDGKPTLQTWHDILGREVKSKTNLYNKDSYTTTIYNNDGTVEKTSLPYFTTNPSKWKEYTYDEFKRIKTITALGLTTSIAYPNGSVETTYPDGTVEKKYHNKAGLIDSISSNNGTVAYIYNGFGKPKTITAAGAVTTMQYDEYGNQTKLIDPDAGTTDYRYNAFGELTYQKDANNNTFTLLYNNKGQLTNKNCNNTQFSTTYTYYPTGLLQKETLGNANSKEYFYNNLGQLTKLNEKIDGAIYSHEYTYDNRGNVLTYKYPSGYTITNEYNTYGYKTGVKEGNTYIWKVSGSDYVNEMGQLKEYLLGPNNIKTKQEYDGNFNLTGINTKTSNNTTLFDYGYSFNHTTGNLTSRTDNTRNLTESFGYDDRQTKHRLTSWSKNNALQGSVDYHPNGNIDFKSDAGVYAYTDNKPHAVREITDNGNSAINLSAQEITYNPFQKTATISENNHFYTITYGTDGQRKKTVLQNDNGATETRIYSGRYEKVGNKEFHYIPTPSGTVAVNIRTGGSGTTYFLLKDHLGSTMKVVNASGSTIEEHSYDAWGNHRNPTNWELTDFTSSLGINRGYTGHEMLPDFQLINMNGRMYDPIIGRVLAPDNFVQNPRNAQNFNRYSYALNNPLLYTDPSGHKWKWWQWALLGIGLSDPATASATIVTTGVGVAGIAFGAAASSYVTTALNAPIMIAAGWCFNNYDGKNAVRNSWRINNGLFVTDPNKNFWGQTWEFTSRFTWEALQTVVGYVYTQGRNFGGNVDRVDYLGGATFATRENYTGKNSGGVTLGNYININTSGEITGSFENYVITHPLFMHEYGHYIDSKIFGISYLFAVGIPSLISAGTSDNLTEPPFDTHSKYWTERRANRHAKKYFGKHSGVDWNAHYGNYWRWDEELQIFIWTPYTIEDAYPTY